MSNTQVPGGAPPGTQNNRNDPRAAANQLVDLQGQAHMELGQALIQRNEKGVTLAGEKLRQIKQVGIALGAQGQKSAPQEQGRQTGVPTPVGRPIDPLTRQPMGQA